MSSSSPIKVKYRSPSTQVDLHTLARALPSGFAHLASRRTWIPARHLNILTQKLVDLEQRRIKRLFVEMPPRHGKSNLCSQYFPAWYLARHPDHQVVLASYESSFAHLWGEKARDAFAEYAPEVFGLTVHPRHRAAEDWRVFGYDGRMRCTGVNGGLTGRGANLLIIDDPIKDAKEASSEVFRNRAWDWYMTVARTRLEPGAVVVVIQTRWHEEDLIGRIRAQSAVSGEQWDSVTMQALCEEPEHDALGRGYGEALWPERYDETALKATRDGMAKHWWDALFQQRPTPPGGNLAQTAWFKLVDKTPIHGSVKRCRFWDIGGEKKADRQDPDYTVGARLARTQDGNFYIEDIIRVQTSAGEVDKLIRRTAEMDGHECIIREEQEPGSSGEAIIALRKKGLAGFNYLGLKALGKPVGWMPMLTAAELGHVYMVRAEWNARYLSEVAAAPYGANDDQLDAVSGSYVALAGTSNLRVAEVLEIGGGEHELKSALERRMF